MKVETLGKAAHRRGRGYLALRNDHAGKRR